MKHIMIDIETLGTGRDSVVMSIGAVMFDAKKVYEDDGYYQAITWQDQLNSGGTVTEGTIRFWLSQPQAARDAVLNREGVKSPIQALGNFGLWFSRHIKDSRQCNVWAKGPAFDLSILGDLYQRVGLKPPWPFWAERCVRTALMMAGVDSISPSSDHIKHHAFSDAVYQAMQVRKFLVACGDKTKPEDNLLT